MGPGSKGGGSAGQDPKTRKVAPGLSNKRRISTRRLQCSYVRRRLQKLASSPPIGNSSNRKQLRAWSFELRTHTSQRQFTGGLTSLQILFFFLISDLTSNHLRLLHALTADPVVSVLSLEHPRLIGSVLRENCDFQMDQLDIRQSRN